MFFLKGECRCFDDNLPGGFLPFNDSTCYQEYLQGPCDNGQQYIRISEVNQCVPTHCPEDHVLYEDTCIPHDGCSSTPNPLVTFDVTNQTSRCDSLDVNLRQIIDFPVNCKAPKVENLYGTSCTKPRSKPKYSSIWYIDFTSFDFFKK